jgi:hypothetical protein
MVGDAVGKASKGRLAVYSRGKAAVSGLGEAALDRALADADWLRQRLGEVECGEPRRAAVWAQLVIEFADLHVSGCHDELCALIATIAGAVIALSGTPLGGVRRNKQQRDTTSSGGRPVLTSHSH